LSLNTITTDTDVFGHGILENQIQALRRTFRHRFKNFLFSVFKDFPSLENPEKNSRTFRNQQKLCIQ